MSKTQVTKIWNDIANITADLTEIKSIIRNIMNNCVLANLMT